MWPDHSHKLSVGALETRNLASVKRWYGKWSAELKPDGAYYLEHGMYPGQAAPTVAPPPAVRPSDDASSDGDAKPAARKVVPVRPLSPSEQLIANVVAAGGSLTLNSKGYDEERRLRGRIDAAQRHGKAPEGKELVVQRPNWETHILTLVAVPEWSLMPVEPIEVPDGLRRPHAAVARLRDDARLFGIEGAKNRSRALRLLQALLHAMASRGHEAASGSDADHLRFKVVGHTMGVKVTQLSDRSDHVPTKKELADFERWHYPRIPQYDYTPGERLKIELTRYHSGSWSDGKRWTLEDRLVKMVAGIERASVEAERAHQAHLERERQAKIVEEQRIARATARMIQANRVRVFDRQLIEWLRSRQMTDYLDAMESVVERIDDPGAGVAAGEWLAWCREHARSIDPLQSGLAMHEDPEPTAANLAPFMERPTYGFMRG